MGTVGLCITAATDFPIERVQRLAGEGYVWNVRLQLNGNTDEVIAANTRQWPRWQAECAAAGIPLYAFVIPDGTPQDAAEMIADVNATEKPYGFMVDVEKWNEGWNMGPVVQALRATGKQVIWNCGGYPNAEYAALDFRRMNAIGRMEWQCYSGRRPPEGPTAADGVRTLFEPEILWAGGDGPAWWYRTQRPNNTYRWLHGSRTVDDDTFELKAPDGSRYHVRVHNGRYVVNRELRTVTGQYAGQLQGFTSYTKIGVMLWKSGLTIEQMEYEAMTARMDGRAKRKVALFDCANLSDEEIRRIARAAA